MKAHLRPKARNVLVLSTLATAGLSLFAAQAAFAAPPSVSSPAATLTIDNSLGVPLATGTQYTASQEFTIPPPNPSFCPGSTSGNYGDTVWSYIVGDNASNGAAPGALTYSGGSLGLLGQLSEGTDVSSALAGVATDVPVSPSTQGELPVAVNGDFSLLQYSGAFEPTEALANAQHPPDLYPGTFDIGIACVSGATSAGGDNTVDEYWNAQIVVTASSDADGFTWSIAAPSSSTPESPLAVGLPLSAVAIAGVSAVVLRRRRRTTAPVA